MVGNNRGGLQFFQTNIRTDGQIISSTATTTAKEICFAVYPNPAGEFVQIQDFPSSEAAIRLFDLQGRLLETHSVGSAQQQLQLPTSHLPAGVYIVQYQSTAVSHSQRLVIQH